MHELAVVRVLYIDHTPAVLAATNRFAVNNHIVLRADNGKRNDVLNQFRSKMR